MPYLIQNPATAEKQIHQLKPGENSIGREIDNNLKVMHGSISRHHAKVIVNGERATIEDLKSRNGTFVNNQKINSCELKNGNFVRCGSVAFKFVDTLANTLPPTQQHQNSEISIIKRLPTDQSRVAIKDLLQQNSTVENGSVLKLKQQNAQQRTVDKLKILLEVSKELSSPEENNRILDKILELLFSIMNIDRAIILLVNEGNGQLETKAIKSKAGLTIDERLYSKKIVNFVYEKGDAILSNDPSIDPRLNDSRSIVQQAIQASMCVPLKPRDEVIGVLYVDNLSTRNAYREEDLEFLTALVNQAAIAIDNAQLYKKMQAEAVVRARLELFFPPTVTRLLREEGKLEIVDTEVTELFSDISDFTKMSSRMEPRQIIEMLNEYFQVMVEDIVFKYEGTLEKYIGDALLAMWGAPYKIDDDADRAVQAAIAMQLAVERLNQQWLQQKRYLPIQIHIGVNSGKVAAGNIGSPRLIQYAAIGDTTNVASRICNEAKAGEIVISESTYKKLSDRTLPLPVEKRSAVKVKGKEDQPLELYQVLWRQVSLTNHNS